MEFDHAARVCFTGSGAALTAFRFKRIAQRGLEEINNNFQSVALNHYGDRNR